ncbi:Fatty acid hydroxylase superfamily [Perilla frutescens var. hirtella]|uniref:Fatty acid hydroxylase superfamily n=1 Tax=Perilla frutescens var. hirtella TaxID=608512 RepID=A0AAD4PDI3_PERFH|nr:Fatty acid hydroxylase superfamily [Perilla frutescens var. hirtella]
MATKPGLLTDWPWKNLGTFKHVIILGPWAMQSIYYYSLARKGSDERDYFNLLIIPFLVSRALHNQIWISISRYITAKGTKRILDRTIEFQQLDRETNWDDQILLQGLLFYIVNKIFSGAAFVPSWRSDGLILTILLHAGPVEFLYYWLHRALHHHFLYSRYHSHHHASIVTEPISSVIHPFAEHIPYFLLFSIPILGTILSGTASLASLFGYVTYIDFMNNMGHCNFEFIPKCLFSIFPPLKYVMYTPSNYSLFMPLYDYIYGTMDKSSDALHEASLDRKEDVPDVVHLTTPLSIFHLQLGFASFASRPLQYSYSNSPRPLSYCFSLVLTFIFRRTFIVDRNLFHHNLNLQVWAIPPYTIQQYFPKWQKEGVKSSIEEAILEADKVGAKVADGSSLAVGIVLNSIPKGTAQVMFRGALSNLALAIVSALCHRGIQVATFYQMEMLKLSTVVSEGQVLLSKSYTQYKVWIIGDGVSEDEQLKAEKGTLFIPFSHFPPKRARHHAFYSHTPSMIAPPSLLNLHSLHALEGWNVHECGDSIFDVNKIWEAALKHGFRPTPISLNHA